MSIAAQLLEDLRQGVPPATIIAHPQYAWNSIPIVERESLLQAAEASGSKNPQLVAIVEHLALKGQDLWSAIQARILRHKLVPQSAEHRQQDLDLVASWLTKLRQNLPIQDVPRYRRYLADYTKLRANHLLEQGRLVDARQQYELAANYYRACGFALGADAATAEAAKVQQLIERQQVLLPLEQLQSQMLILAEEIDQLSQQAAAKKAENQILEQDNERLRQEASSCRAALEALTAQVASLKAEIEEQTNALNAQAHKVAATVQWLHALSEAAMAPVWVRAARAALWKGEIDAISIHALQQLAQAFPEEALPLLVEIAARAPEAVDAEGLAELAEFQRNVQLARAQRDTDPLAAAEALVNAWEFALRLEGHANNAS